MFSYHEGETLHSFSYGRDPDHHLGHLGLGCYDRTRGAAQRLQYDPAALLLGELRRGVDAIYHCSVCRVHGDSKCVASPPPRRPLTSALEETARRQRYCLATGLLGGPFPLRRPLGRLAEHARSA